MVRRPRYFVVLGALALLSIGWGGPSHAAESALAMCPKIVGTERVAPISSSVAAAIQTRVERTIGGTVRSVCRMPFGLYEVVDDMDVVYVDAAVRYLIVGRAFALGGPMAEDLTTSRQEAFSRVDVESLPFAMAIKTVRGDGSRILVEFEDPNCPYCRRFEREIVGLNNVTIYTFLYPVLSRNRTDPDDSYPQARSVWCSANRSHVWEEVMLKGVRLPPAPASCNAPLDQNLALGRELKITGTPTLIFADGRRVPGVISLASVEHLLNATAKEK